MTTRSPTRGTSTGDGTPDSTTPTASYTYTTAGNYTARLTVTDADGRTGTTNIDITVGNTAPSVELILPKDGGFFDFGDYVKYEVVVTDAEDGEIDCDDVVVQPGLGHDQHSHDYEQYTGCEGSFPLPGDAGHVGANIFGTIKATYTDKGNGAAGALTSVDGIVLHPSTRRPSSTTPPAAPAATPPARQVSRRRPRPTAAVGRT